jgi:ribonuclease HI
MKNGIGFLNTCCNYFNVVSKFHSFVNMKKVKVFAKSEVDLTQKVGVYAYCLYGYPDQLSNARPFKNGIKTMTHADCMAFVNALDILSRTAAGEEIEELEVVTDSSKVVALVMEGKGEKHCEAAAAHWMQVVKPRMTNLKHITITKTDRKGFGPAENIAILKRLQLHADRVLDDLKVLAH